MNTLWSVVLRFQSSADVVKNFLPILACNSITNNFLWPVLLSVFMCTSKFFKFVPLDAFCDIYFVIDSSSDRSSFVRLSRPLNFVVISSNIVHLFFYLF